MSSACALRLLLHNYASLRGELLFVAACVPRVFFLLQALVNLSHMPAQQFARTPGYNASGGRKLLSAATCIGVAKAPPPYLVILCCERRCPKQILLLARRLAPPKVWTGYVTGNIYIAPAPFFLNALQPCLSASEWWLSVRADSCMCVLQLVADFDAPATSTTVSGHISCLHWWPQPQFAKQGSYASCFSIGWKQGARQSLLTT